MSTTLDTPTLHQIGSYCPTREAKIRTPYPAQSIKRKPSIKRKKVFVKYCFTLLVYHYQHPTLQTYTIRQLLDRLTIYSDNNAKDLLHDNIDQNSVNDVFTDLGLQAPGLQDTGDSMSTKDYSLFFRVLYNATYLNKEMSELALSILSHTKFNVGLQAGMPASTTIAHKFGHRAFSTPVDGVTEELHDCGIVYESPDPYFICVMTKGWNVQDLESVIANISKTIHNSRYK